MPCAQYCRKEFLYSLILCIGSVTFGFAIGFTSPALPEMRKEFPSVSENSLTLFNSMTPLAAIFGPFLVNAFVAPPLNLGRRTSTFAFSVSGAGFWLLLLATSEHSFWIGILARGLIGVIVGCISAIVPMYVVELSPPALTGFFGSFPQLFLATGTTLCYLIGTWVPWRTVAVVGAGTGIALGFLIWIVPESPVSGKPPDMEGEALCSRKWIKRMIVGAGFNAFQQFTGINSIITELDDLFSQAHVPIDPGYASTIAMGAQVIASALAAPAITQFGRKPIWVLSFGVIVLTDVLYAATVSPIQDRKHIFPSWLSIVVIFVNQFGYALGAGPIPWFIVAEMFPDFVRPTAMALSACACWLFTFVTIQMQEPLSKAIGEWGSFLVFAGISLVGLIFGIVAIRDPVEAVQKLETKEAYDELISSS
jgi:MFS family permease